MRTRLRVVCFALLLSNLPLFLLAVGNPALAAHQSQSSQQTQSPETGATTPFSGAAGVAFTSQSSLLPHKALGMAAADFDSDGKTDLAIIDASGVSIFLANGDGTFQSGSVYPLPQSVFIAAADFNGDGHADLAITRANGNVSILLGNGDGTFKAAVNYEVGAGPQGLAIGDFNGDGVLDLAVANAGLANGKYAGNTVSVLLGNGDGTFHPQKSFPTAEGPFSIVAADLSGTGHLDLVVATSGPFGVVSVLPGNGDGTFQPSVDFRTSQDPQAQARTVLAADLNGDGAQDLVVLNNISTSAEANTELSVLLASRDGTWQPLLTYKPWPAQQAPVAANALVQAVLADLDGDGKLDLICVGNQVSVQLGNGDGTFGTPMIYPPSDAAGVVAFDFDDDGLLDLAVAGRSITILRNSPIALLGGTSGVFPPRQLHTASPPVTAVLSNPNHVPLKLSGIEISGDFSQTNNCGSQLPAGSQCRIAITFSPAETGVRTGTLSVLDSAGRPMRTLALTGAGITQGPVVALSPSSLTFAGLRVATQATQTVQLTNTGNAPLSLTSVFVTGAGQFSVTNNCGATVAASGSCTLTVTFSPTFPETQTGAVSIVDNAPDSPQTVSLTGSGESLAFSKTNLNFQPVVVGQTSSTLQSVTLFNVGPGVVTFTAIGITGSNASDFQWLPNSGPQPSCPLPGVLRAGDHCYLSVSFTPSAIGMRTASLSVSDDRDPFPAILPLSGVGKAIGPIASFSPSSLSFGAVPDGNHKNLILQLTNSGDQSLSIVSIAISDQFSQTNNCGTNLMAAATCQFTVTFSPTSGGPQSGSLQITDNALHSPQSVSMTGTGQNIIFSKTSLVFPTVPVGQTAATRSVSLFSLSGNAIVIGTLGGANAGDFQVVSMSCGTLGNPVEVRRGDPCILELTFTPSGKGARVAQLTFMNENPASGPAVVLPLSGSGT